MEKLIILDKHRAAFARFQKERGLKNDPWAKKAGIKEGTIRAFLKGKTRSMKMETLGKLAIAANATVQEMLGEANTKGSNLKYSLETEVPRKQLDRAIEMWFADEDSSLIRPLITAAYNEFHRIAKEQGLLLPTLKSNDNIEGVLVYTIAALQSLHKELNRVELAFYSWLSLREPNLFADSARIFLRNLNFINKDAGKSDFFESFTGKAV